MRNLWQVCSVSVLLSVPAAHAAEPVRAGAARVAFALPAGVPLAGYSRRDGRPSQGVQQPVHARAVVLAQGTTHVVLVSAELLIIDEALHAAVHQRLQEAGWAAETVVWLAATHTHSGPGAYGRRFAEKISMGHFEAAVFDALADGIVEAVLAARAQLAPVRIGYHAVATEGLVQNRAAEDGLVDAALIVVGLYPATEAATPLAVLASFAAHPTTLGAENMQLSGDYPGLWAAGIEQAYPGAVALFFAGAVGDQAPVKVGQGLARAEHVAQPLIQQTRAALAALPTIVPQQLAARQEILPLPRARVRLSPRWGLPRWLSRRLVDNDATLTLWQIGPVVGLGTPCDLEASLGAALQTAARAQHHQPLVASFVNDYIGYCVSPARYAEGAYEALMAFNGPTTGPLLVEALQRLLERRP